MLSNRSIIADMHTHTLMSGHAYSTLAENCRAAARRGHSHIAMTDHAPAMMGAPSIIYFTADAPKMVEGVRVIKGAELNILDAEGTVDLPERALGRLEYTVASFHEIVTKPMDAEAHTGAYLRVLEHPKVDCLGHVGNGNFPFDLERVIRRCAELHKLIEINNHSFSVRPGSRENCAEVARLCMRHGVCIVVTSDAHFEDEVGDFPESLGLLEAAGFPEERILNASTDRLRRWFRERKGIDI